METTQFSAPTPIRVSSKSVESGAVYWWYMCRCGKKFRALKHNVTGGRVSSCGCAPKGRRKKESSANDYVKKKRGRLITLGEETLSTAEWCKRLGLSRNTLRHRLLAGYSVKQALSTPKGKRVKKEERKKKTLKRNYTK